MRTLNDDEWKEHFRMTRQTFSYICNRLRRHITKQNTRLRLPIPVEKRVALALWRLATNIELRTLATLFGVGRATPRSYKMLKKCTLQFFSQKNLKYQPIQKHSLKLQ